jgi:hypothetical protein
MNRTASVGHASASRPPSDGVPSRLRARRTNDPTAGLSRRAADLVRSYLVALGNPQETGRQAEIIAAAEMQVLAEEARAAALREPSKANLLNSAVRVQRAADQALRRLGIKASSGPKEPTLAEYLAAKAEAAQ